MRVALIGATGVIGRYIVQHLIDQGVTIGPAKQLRYSNDRAALLEAAAQGHAKVVQVLLEHGANVSQQRHDGATPLRLAAAGGHYETAQLLIAHQADVNGPAGGFTPLFDAAAGGHLDVVKLLVAAGAEIDVTRHGRTPRDQALRYGQTVVLDYLREVSD